MRDRVDAGVLWFRALTVASVFFFLGVAGHVTADGRLPGLAVLAAFFTMSVLLSVPLLSRPASAARLVAMVVGGQTVLHVALSVTAGHRGDVTAPAPTAFGPTSTGSLPVVDGRRVGSLQDAFDPVTGTDALTAGLPVGHLVADLRSHAAMMVAHLAVAVVVGLWLAVGERALWTLLALAGRRFAPRLVVHRTAHRPARVTPVPVHHLPVRTTVWLAGPQSRRGPPLRAA